MKFFKLFLFCGSFLPSWIWNRIWIRNPDPVVSDFQDAMERLDQVISIPRTSARSPETEMSRPGIEHGSPRWEASTLAKRYSKSVLIAIRNIYIWSRDNQCRNDPNSRIRIRTKSFRIHKTEILLKTEDMFPSYLLHSCPKFHWIFWMLLLFTTLVPFWLIFSVSSSVVDPDWFILDSYLIFGHL